MSNTSQNFKIVAAITGYELRKSEDGTEKYVLSGMASNTTIDLTGSSGQTWPTSLIAAAVAYAENMVAWELTIRERDGGRCSLRRRF